ncbi:nitroreductase family protein [Sphingomonas psychrotolerans]|uniref:Nitroreductase family protein n=1 Tax=Sphingomonas psychrotolerans TaxID=1327635 RepID=A0A2K8MJR1_9SPHN|nr:nitroreductase family protein [Sphingomonas psychrotolerans]ATY34110.1 nitroreductase family protein [Sphingomonas psychrotolerans]
MFDREVLPWQPYPNLTDAERIARARAFNASMQSRRSCRAFSEEPVPREIIEAALATAGSAPNGANRQPWHFCVVSSPEAKCAIRIAAEEEERAFYDGRAGSEWLDALVPLGTGADKPYLETAPWLIVVFAQRRGGPDLDDLKQNYYVTESVGLACGLLLATLHQAGIATLVHTPNPMRFLNRVCRRPDHEKPLMVIVAGHAAPDAVIPAHALDKKTLEQIASWL